MIGRIHNGEYMSIKYPCMYVGSSAARNAGGVVSRWSGSSAMENTMKWPLAYDDCRWNGSSACEECQWSGSSAHTKCTFFRQYKAMPARVVPLLREMPVKCFFYLWSEFSSQKVAPYLQSLANLNVTITLCEVFGIIHGVLLHKISMRTIL